MASDRDKKPEEEEERKIPVFTVIRNGAILKNIFVINKSPIPSPTSSQQSTGNEENPFQETQEILTVGRHPDCNIVLNHPSISRFHLQINSKPSSQKLFVTDLSSVHGTWVSGKKIEPGCHAELREGDTIRVGGSTRVYSLHWVPLSRAYDMENPFILPSYMTIIEEKREENSGLEEENEVKMSQHENILANETESVEENGSQEVARKEERYQAMGSISFDNGEIQSLDLILKDLVSLFCDEIYESTVKNEFSVCDAKEGTESSIRIDNQVREILSPTTAKGVILETKSQQFDGCNQSPEYYSVQQELPETINKGSSLSNSAVNMLSTSSMGEVECHVFERLEEPEIRNLLMKDHEEMDILSNGIEMLNLQLPGGDHSENDSEKFNDASQNPEHLIALQTAYEEESQENASENVLLNLNSASSDGHAATYVLEMRNDSPSRDGHEQSGYASVSSALLAEESVNSCFPVGVLSEITDSQKCQTSQSVFASIENRENVQSCHIRSDTKHSSCNIWSRRGKSNAVLQLQTSRSRGKNRRADIEWETRENFENRSITKTHIPCALDEILTPGKENYSPNTLLFKSLKWKGKPEGMQLGSCKSYSEITSSPNKYPKASMVSSDKENRTPKVFQQRKSAIPATKNQAKLKQDMVLKRGSEEGRLPLKSLLVNFSANSISEACEFNDATGSSTSVNFSQTMLKDFFGGKRRWIMVADTSSLLDCESRKSLKLLQGLKGTHLVIPERVIRELDCMKHRGSLFKRKTEASLVLEWIEECMVRTKWWIHVQSCMEEGRQIAPTPPASPKSQFNQGNEGLSYGTTGSFPFSTCESLLEIVSPKAEDYILDYALSYRKMNKDGQLVLLSNDVTLKIKAMVEGLICETAKEFRDSLVNPFSERFLWVDSSPRGLTWSVLDDLVLKERYYPSPLKKSSKGEGAKGLKLILLHNTHYGQISSQS